MREIKESRCSVCGDDIEQRERGGRRKYCSKKCSNKHNNHKSLMKEKLPAGSAKCVQCGKEFERSDNSTRECCSRICERAWGRRDEIAEILELSLKNKGNLHGLRSWALELHYNGYGRKAITDAFGLSRRTLKTWLEQFTRGTDGNWRRNRRTHPHYSYPESETAAEWLSALRYGVSGTRYCVCDSVLESRRIFIVCGVTDIRKGSDSLSAVIQYELHMDPFEGDVFAFCGKKRDQIRYIYWDGSGFNVVLRGRERGTYPWPPQKLGMVIPIRSEDFEYVLRGERDFSKCGSLAKSGDCIALPESF